MLLIYTGNGKGKTSSSIGQAVRALGADMRVAFGQFMKQQGQAGEQKMLEKLLGDHFCVSGAGFFRNEKDREKHAKPADALVLWAHEQVDKGLDMLILDECLYALSAGLISREEVEELVDKCREKKVHLVLSGRGLPDWLKEKADLVSEIMEVKHPYAQGIPAQKGVDF